MSTRLVISTALRTDNPDHQLLIAWLDAQNAAGVDTAAALRAALAIAAGDDGLSASISNRGYADIEVLPAAAHNFPLPLAERPIGMAGDEMITILQALVRLVVEELRAANVPAAEEKVARAVEELSPTLRTTLLGAMHSARE